MEFTFESDKPEDFHILQIRDQDLKTEEEKIAFVQSPDEMHQLGHGMGIGGDAMNGLAALKTSTTGRSRTPSPS